MGISFVKAEVVGQDLLADQFVQIFAETDVIDVNLTFDLDDPKDAKIAKQIEMAETMLADAESDYETAKAENDESTMDRATAQIVAMSNLVTRYKDTAFGYYKRTDGKETVLKGSLLDRVLKAVTDLNKRTSWLGGKSIRINSVDKDRHTLKLVRSDKKVRTRTLRPSMESIVSQIDAAFPTIETDN